MTRQNDPLDLLARLKPPAASPEKRDEALARALAEFDGAKNSARQTKGSGLLARLFSGAHELWRNSMTTKTLAGPALATILLVPVAAIATYEYINSQSATAPSPLPRPQPAEVPAAVEQQATPSPGDDLAAAGKAADGAQADVAIREEREALAPLDTYPVTTLVRPRAVTTGERQLSSEPFYSSPPVSDRVASMPMPSPEPLPLPQANRDRVEGFATNPVKRVAEEPVSTFSLDVDTASYSFVRRMLKAGIMPQPDGVRVEELVNYFPYAWPAPETAETPFEPTVTVVPSPWHDQKLLMHVAIKGFEIADAQRPTANLVFLVDTSGSMQDADKLPLVKASLKLLLDRLGDDDTIGLVTYAGHAGVALEPTKVADRAKILAAIDSLGAGGSTAGAAGLEEAYRLAEKGFVDGGVNRVLLATDGDFNVGPSDDESLRRLVERKRDGGVFLTVMGFGQGNYNDRLMQVLAQNGNGAAVYVDTLAEAEKTLVQEAGSTLFPIAKDVKVQVEFNPDRISEYRLIGYETRALAREDFNNDRVDAGEIGSGHSVTAIYEMTPKDSPAQTVDALRYQNGETAPASAPAAGNGEFAYVKIRYKRPDSATSQLLARPVTPADALESLEQAGEDVRFSIGVAAFGQKLRDADATADMDWERIRTIAEGARGADPFGYRAEFLTLVRLAKGLSGN